MFPSVRRRGLAATIVVAALFALVIPASPASADPPTTYPSAVAASRWLAAQVGPDGSATSPFSAGAPDVSTTRDIAIALAATGWDAPTFERVMGWLTDNAESVVAPFGTDSPGSIGYLLMLVAATGGDPTNFGGVDLLARLQASLDAFEPGLWGADDPTFDGVFRQSLGILGLVAVGVTPPAPAVQWLVAQQCVGEGDPGAEGGWTAYRTAGTGCTDPDPLSYLGTDNDSTSMAVQALVALGGGPGVSSGLDYLERWQDDDGGFAWYGGGDAVPNSTALAISAIVAAGEDPSQGRWGSGQASAVAWLEAQQLPCDNPDAGAFTSVFSEGGPDQFSTRQAVLGVARVAFPLAPVNFGEAALDPCADIEDPTDPVLPVAQPVTPTASPVAAAAVVTPRFTG